MISLFRAISVLKGSWSWAKNGAVVIDIAYPWWEDSSGLAGIK
jgi:hypothetical protein